jgi:8-oxo-dGTP pyrophosphatase MutT (NUDIX family)
MKKSAGVLIFNNDSVLMQLRDNIPSIALPNHWSFPGGGVEKGEKPCETAIREIKEECDYNLNPKKLFKMLRTRGVVENNVILEVNVYIAKYDLNQMVDCLEGQRMEFIRVSEVLKLKNTTQYVRFIVSEGFKLFNVLYSEGYFN